MSYDAVVDEEKPKKPVSTKPVAVTLKMRRADFLTIPEEQRTPEKIAEKFLATLHKALADAIWDHADFEDEMEVTLTLQADRELSDRRRKRESLDRAKRPLRSMTRVNGKPLPTEAA